MKNQPGATPSTQSVSAKPRQAELAIAYVLRGGVMLSGLVISVGLLLEFLRARTAQIASAQSLPSLLSGDLEVGAGHALHLSAWLAGMRTGEPESVILLGLILLIALPIVRVGMTIIVFLHERDYVYFWITLFVFSVLICGVLLGKGL